MIIMIMMVVVVVTKQNLFINFTIEIKSDLHTEQETWRLFPACSLYAAIPYGRHTRLRNRLINGFSIISEMNKDFPAI